MKKHLIGALLFSILAGCGGSAVDQGKENSNNSDGSGILAVGWDHVKMQAAGSETKIFPIGTFEASWTPCYRGSSGQIKDPQAWETLVKSVNAAIKMAPRGEEQCWEAAETNKLNNYAQAIVLPEKRPMELIDAWGGRKLCTKIPDLQLAKNLALALNVVAIQAEKEDCYRER
jgi:hypothetical protein